MKPILDRILRATGKPYHPTVNNNSYHLYGAHQNITTRSNFAIVLYFMQKRRQSAVIKFDHGKIVFLQNIRDDRYNIGSYNTLMMSMLTIPCFNDHLHTEFDLLQFAIFYKFDNFIPRSICCAGQRTSFFSLAGLGK